MKVLDLSRPRTTRRLILRGLTVKDVDDLTTYRSLTSVRRFIPGEPETRADIEERLMTRWAIRSLTDEGGGIGIGIEIINTRRVIGDMSFSVVSAHDANGEIGWVLNPAFSGHGFATEAAHGLMHMAFDELEIRRIIARIDARNEASLRLAERLTMRKEAHLIENEFFKGEFTDEIDYALLRREFRCTSALGPCPWGYASVVTAD